MEVLVRGKCSRGALFLGGVLSNSLGIVHRRFLLLSYLIR